MITTGRPIWIPILALLIPLNPPAAHSPDRPPTTPTPVPQRIGDTTRLSDYAERIALDRSCIGAQGESMTITTETVRELAARGPLTVGAPRDRLSPGAAPPGNQPDTTNLERLREEWRAKVLRQRDQVAKIQGDIVLLDAKIEAIRSTATRGRDAAVRQQARLMEARGQRTVLTRRLATERARLGALIRHARQQGAQPGWFR